MMEISKKWTVVLNNNILGGGVLLPTIDPFDKSVFYISDGWGTAYSSMRLRKISIENGMEIANVRTKDITRCMNVNENYVFAILNKRILKLNKNDFSVVSEYKNSIPRYSDYVGSDDKSTLLLMNHMSDYLHLFDLQSQTSKKKKISGCCGIIKVTADIFWVCNYEGVFKYSLKTNTLEKLLDIEPYMCWASTKLGLLYTLCKEKLIIYNNEEENSLYSSKILVYSPITKDIPQEIIPGVLFSSFVLSNDEKILYLYADNQLWLYSLVEKKIIFNHIFSQEKILNIFDEGHIIITCDATEEKSNMTCWVLNPQ